MAIKTAIVTARIAPDTKASAEKILNELGLSVSDAVNLFYRQIIKTRGLPFRPTVEGPRAVEDMNATEIRKMLDESEEDIKAGKVVALEEAVDDFRREQDNATIQSPANANGEERFSSN